MKQRTWLVCVSSAVLACGGADQSNLLSDAGAQIDTGSQADVTTDTGNQNDVANDAPTVKDVVTVDVPVGPPDSKIQCGPTSLTCSAQTQLCCHHTASSSKPWECVADISACGGNSDVPIACSNHDNCASQGAPSDICCANTQQGNQCTEASDVSCMATCDPQQGQIQVGCNSTDPCPSTQTCTVSTCTFVGYHICL